MTMSKNKLATDAYLSALRKEICYLSEDYEAYTRALEKVHDQFLEQPGRDYLTTAFTKHATNKEAGLCDRTKMLGNLLGFKYEPVLEVRYTNHGSRLNQDLLMGDKLYFEQSTPYDVELVTDQIENAIALLEASVKCF